MKKGFVITIISLISINIIFSLSWISAIETTYAYHNKFHLNNSFTDVTISGDDIPDSLLENIKKNIERKLNAEENKTNQNNNVSKLETKTNTDNTKGNIILTSQKFKKGDSPQIVGQVKNIGNGTAEDIRITYSYYDQNNDILGSEIIYLDISKLMVGQKASFSNYLTDELVIDEITHYELGLTWNNLDGSETYVEDVQVIKDKPVVTSSIEDNGSVTNFNPDNQDDEDKDEDDGEDEDDEDDS